MMQEAKHRVRVTLTPLLKFHELEASLGSAEFGFEDPTQVPIITATLGTKFDPSWDYNNSSKRGVLGDKRMYLLIKAPKSLAKGQALLQLEADVRVRGVLLPAVLRCRKEPAVEQLTVSLWG